MVALHGKLQISQGKTQYMHQYMFLDLFFILLFSLSDPIPYRKLLENHREAKRVESKHGHLSKDRNWIKLLGSMGLACVYSALHPAPRAMPGT